MTLTEEHDTRLSEKVYWLHYILIAWFLFLLVQDLIAWNMARWSFIVKIVKSVDEGVSLGLIVLLFFSGIVNGRLLYKTNIDIPLIIFIVIALLSSILNQVPFGIYSSQFIIYMKGFLTFYIMANLPMNRRTFSLYQRAIFGSGIVIFLFGIIDFFMPVTFRTLIGTRTFVQYFLSLPSVESLFTHPLFFGWFMSFSGCYLFAYFTLEKKPYHIIFFLCALTGTFMSLRAKAIIGIIYATFTGFFLLLLKKQVRARIFFVFILFFIIVLIFFTPYIREVIRSKLQLYVYSENISDIARNMLYAKSLEIGRDMFPLGVGLGRYGSWYSRVFYSPVYYKYGLSEVYLMSSDMPGGINDTFWPMIIGENGFIGCIVYGMIFIIFLISVYRQYKHTADISIRAFQFGTFMMLIESIIESIASPIYVQPPFTFYIFGALGLCYALSRKDTLMHFELSRQEQEPAKGNTA